MGSKLVATIFCLVFAVPFGGIGAGAAWMIAGMFQTASRADDWVVVQATVAKADLTSSRSKNSTSYAASGTYHYTFEGKPYSGAKLGVSPVEGSDNIGDWQESMAAFLEEARSKGKTIPVYVNPDNPAEAVVDREVRWPLVMFAGTFALVFGGVGLGAFIAIIAIWRSPGGIEGAEIRKAKARKNPGSAAKSDAWKAAGFLWVFAFFWNAISWPITFLAIPEIIANEEWVGLLVLLFPLIGILVLWAAFATTLGLLKRGNATLTLQPETPRAGGTLNGWVNFPRGVKAGEAFKIRLLCARTEQWQNRTTTTSAWSRDTTGNATESAGGTRVPFRFDVPADVPLDGNVGARKITHAWRIEAQPARGVGGAYGFDIEMAAAPQTDFSVPQANAPMMGKPAASPGTSAASLAQLLGPQFAANLSESQRASFAAMGAKEQELAGNIVRNAPKVKKIVIGVVIFFIALQVLDFVIMAARSLF